MKDDKWRTIRNTLYSLSNEDEITLLQYIIQGFKSEGIAKKVKIIGDSSNELILSAINSFNDKSADFEIIISDNDNENENYQLVRKQVNLNLKPQLYLLPTFESKPIYNGNIEGLEIDFDCLDEEQRRKFITMRSSDNLILVIGPEYSFSDNSKSYDHFSIKETLNLTSEENLKISGGGMLEIYKRDSERCLNFSGSSYDFGPYDPLILIHQYTFSDMLQKGLNDKYEIDFIWKSK